MCDEAVQRANPDLVAEDAAARLLAQTCFDRPLVLEAGAGTGKTTALVSRVVAFALGEGWERAAAHLTASAAAPAADRVAARVLQRMVAITFTEPAAAEMATRVGATLSKIAGGATLEVLAESDGLAPAALPGDADERCARARALASALDRFGVRTIHAFARRLLATHPLEAGLHPAFEVDPEGRVTAEIVREILEAKFREAYGDPGDPVLLGLAARGVTASRIEDDLLGLLRAATPPELLADDPFTAARLEPLRDEIVAGLERLCRLGGTGLGSKTRTQVAAELVTHAGEACHRLRATVLPGLAGVEFLQRTLVETIGARVERLGKWAKDDFSESERKALGAAVCAEIQPLAACLHPKVASLQDLDAATLDLARRALAPLLAEASAVLRARGVVSYDDLLRGAARLLEDRPEVAARERAQIDQILVDEFQDTDGLQCAMIERLALEGDVRPGLFLVGDPKQSIYGWRGADLAAYDSFLEKVCAAGGRLCRLFVNRRSVQPVLDEVERVIRPSMHAERGVQPAFQPLLAHREGGGYSGHGRRAVEYWVSRASPRPEGGTKKSDATAIEARALARDVAELVHERGVAPRDVGVLLRSFSAVEVYLAALREAGVPVAVARDRAYYRRREIVDALCLVRCVIDPGDALALIALLRSSVVGVPDAALLPLWRERVPSLVARLPEGGEQALREIQRAVLAAARALPSGVPGIEETTGWEHGLLFAIEALGRLRESFVRDAADVFVERLRTFWLFEASEAARPLGTFRIVNLERFFRELSTALSEGVDPFELLRQLRRCGRDEGESQEVRPLDAAEDAVKVMTIHGAKGLGFAHTYVAELHKESRGKRGSDAPPRVIAIRGNAELRLLGEQTPGFVEIEALEARTAEAEHVRTLYVAMTRAKDRLVLAGLWPETGRRSSADTHVALLANRKGGAPPLDEAFERCAGTAGEDRFEANDALWVFPALGADLAAGRRVGLEESDGADAAARGALAADDSERLAVERVRAGERMQRGFGGPVTQEAHEWDAERRDRSRDGEAVRSSSGEAVIGPSATPGEPGAQDTAGASVACDSVASAVGTAMHRALEELDPSAAPDRALAMLRAAADRALESAGLGGDALSEARARASDLAERFVSSGLLRRLERLAPHVVARELPVLLAPAETGTGATGYVAGRIDLVYLDPDTGDPVVADYKTGRSETESEIRDATTLYAAQGAHYVRAVRDALGLAKLPRFELWFVHAGRVETAG
ncbi:MAG: UvrD-helicase domain-containing protein [Deltaproteobacteria bacterium]|nr:UvrD-helicase domain-containing protein [Deltaproteobacteria bacterium]